MNEAETPSFALLPWRNKLALIFFAPFMLLALPLLALLGVVIVIFATLANFLSQRGFLRQMKFAGRYLTRSELRARVEEFGGTLIVEDPSLGWNFTHAWWTPDDLLALSPFPQPTDEEYDNAVKTMNCLDWDRWCWENYTSPDKGRAYLLRTWNGVTMERFFETRFPTTKRVRTWTALVHFPNSPPTMNSDEPTPQA